MPPSCCGVSAEVRRRTYLATLADVPGELGNVLVTLTEASFLHHPACQDSKLPPSAAPLCNQIYAGPDDFRDGAYWFAFSQVPAIQGRRIVEQLPGGAWLALDGEVGGPVQDRRITATRAIFQSRSATTSCTSRRTRRHRRSASCG